MSSVVIVSDDNCASGAICRFGGKELITWTGEPQTSFNIWEEDILHCPPPTKRSIDNFLQMNHLSLFFAVRTIDISSLANRSSNTMTSEEASYDASAVTPGDADSAFLDEATASTKPRKKVCLAYPMLQLELELSKHFQGS
jgi:hypothetical protein